jgi:hypothetical protein
MSKNRVDKGKFVNKLHQLQKRLFRMEQNEGHSVEKFGKRKGTLKRLIDKVRGAYKPKSVLRDIDTTKEDF